MRALLPVLVFGLTGACAPQTNETGRAFQASGEIIAMGGGEGGAKNACFSCHGLSGEGDGVSTPRLAGLDAGYLQKQLKDYASGVRADPVMGPIAKPLDDDAQRSVAQYYAGMSAPVAVAGPPPAAYVRPGPDGTPSCADCHGMEGRGGGAGPPALAGQPAAYTADQLRRWARAERRNDPRAVMRTAVAGLTGQESAAIGAWLASPTASRSPDNAAAVASAAAAPEE